jgi:hypothetical protein
MAIPSFLSRCSASTLRLNSACKCVSPASIANPTNTHPTTSACPSLNTVRVTVPVPTVAVPAETSCVTVVSFPSCTNTKTEVSTSTHTNTAIPTSFSNLSFRAGTPLPNIPSSLGSNLGLLLFGHPAQVPIGTNNLQRRIRSLQQTRLLCKPISKFLTCKHN